MPKFMDRQIDIIEETAIHRHERDPREVDREEPGEGQF
jgi:hypothetical protein